MIDVLRKELITAGRPFPSTSSIAVIRGLKLPLLAVLAGCALVLGGALPADARSPVDGSHDFDFDLGVWKTNITRRLHPLTGSAKTIQLMGTVTVRALWDGRAQVEEIETDGPNGHWEGMTVFLYDASARQWSMNFANSSRGKFETPMIGGFAKGRGVLVSRDTLGGHPILVRGVWSDFSPTSHTYQESYSADGGKTWEVEFTAHKTKSDQG